MNVPTEKTCQIETGTEMKSTQKRFGSETFKKQSRTKHKKKERRERSTDNADSTGVKFLSLGFVVAVVVNKWGKWKYVLKIKFQDNDCHKIPVSRRKCGVSNSSRSDMHTQEDMGSYKSLQFPTIIWRELEGGGGKIQVLTAFQQHGKQRPEDWRQNVQLVLNALLNALDKLSKNDRVWSYCL